MLSEDALRNIAEVFIRDQEELFTYKTGPKLVKFFNDNFGFNDRYGQGFPSRWLYTVEKIRNLLNSNKGNKFFSLILSKSYLMNEQQLTEVDALILSEKMILAFNKILKPDNLILVKKGEEIQLITEDTDLEFIGEGGFAVVHKRKSNGLIIKKLREEFMTKRDIRSRFKREYELTKSLSDIPGIIQVYNFDDDSCSYTMKCAETSLYDYVTKNSLSDENLKTMLRQILYIMTRVHERNIIHRDISPNNILIINGMLHISDFGLGKDLDIFHSHQTVHTNAFGQFYYCAPEQFMQLRDGDKRSDVFSMGRLINFIFKKDPRDYNHVLRSVAEKATNETPEYRYEDAKRLSEAVEKGLVYGENRERNEVVKNKIILNQYDDDVENYIYNLTEKELCMNIISLTNFSDILIRFLRENEKRGNQILSLIGDTYRDYCNDFPIYDNFSRLAFDILNLDNTSYITKEIAARILNDIAYGVNRFEAQRFVTVLLDKGLEPTIEEILSIN
ncbi:protein kinase [Lysinibacillus sp. FSL W7-1291]|uniref:protein kinase domain-containing protein n=1 Tax=Lysinibacillus sp. FSL W7-1291 TaxID=2954544 RepID=UPI003159DF91